MNIKATTRGLAFFCSLTTICCVDRCQAMRTWIDGVAEILPGVLDRPCTPRGCSGNVLEISMAYRYYLPQDYDPAVEYPLLLFLHGASHHGRDNVSQVHVHIGNMIRQTESNYPAILVAPQLLESSGWSPLSHIDRTDDILDVMLRDFSIDTDRLYLTGLSMGGFGTTSYLNYFNVQNPDQLQFAAAAPAAGAFLSESAAAALADTPIWLAHGSADTVVSPDTSRGTFNVLTGAERDAAIDFTETAGGGPTAIRGNKRYTEYPGVGHNSWSRFYAQDELYEWMFAQSLVPEPSSLALLGLAAFSAACFVKRTRRAV